MPSKSPAQHRLMEAAAHTPGGYGGVPQKVGQEFAAADKSENGHMAKRRKQGLKHREIAAEFGKSRSTIGRRLKGHGDMMKQGFARMGRAGE